MRLPVKIVPETEYKQAFRKYVFGLAEKWLDEKLEAEKPDAVLTRIRKASHRNHRLTYLPYLLPFADVRYEGAVPEETVAAMRAALFGMRMNGLPYNDFMLDRFCDILLEGADPADFPGTPLPEDYKDLQKLIWTFVQSFRRDVNLRYPGEDEAI